VTTWVQSLLTVGEKNKKKNHMIITEDLQEQVTKLNIHLMTKTLTGIKETSSV
jgi:hypothetical protein